MFSYYRTLFDISSQGDDLFGLDLMRDVEEVVRTWVQESFPEYPEILEDPQNAGQSRQWERADALLRLSGGTTETKAISGCVGTWKRMQATTTSVTWDSGWRPRAMKYKPMSR